MMKKIFTYIFTFVFMLGLVGCEMGGSKNPGENPGGTDAPHVHEYVNGKCSCGETDPNQGGNNNGLITDEELKTPYTDKLKLTASYAGKSFVRDGIGEVKLTNAIDGDTATFNDTGTTITVRFNAVNTPESTYKLEPWGKAAARFTANIGSLVITMYSYLSKLYSSIFSTNGVSILTPLNLNLPMK